VAPAICTRAYISDGVGQPAHCWPAAQLSANSLFCSRGSLTVTAGSRMLSFFARPILLKRIRSSSALDTNLMTSPMFVLHCWVPSGDEMTDVSPCRLPRYVCTLDRVCIPERRWRGDKKLVSRVCVMGQGNPYKQATKPFSGCDEVILKQIGDYRIVVYSARAGR